MSARSRASTFVASPAFYERTINWRQRLARELPVLMDVLGPPGTLGLLDAGCGTGRHAMALADEGYRVVAADASAEMLQFARGAAGARRVRRGTKGVRFVRAAYDELGRRVRGPFDGIYCLGNALASSGSDEAVRGALAGFARVLRPGGRLFVQIINFAEVRRTASHGGYVRGPQIVRAGRREYLSFKVFHADEAKVTVTGLVLWREQRRWQRHVLQGHLAAVEQRPLAQWLRSAGFRVLGEYGSYAREPFDVRTSGDLIVVAERRGRG